MKLTKLSIAAVAFLTASAGAASAGNCGYEYCWGAVGIGANGAWGWSHSHASESDAIVSAQDGCKGNCSTIRTFYNTCGAIAVADNGGWGFGWHGDKELAQSTAMNYCMDNGHNCEVRVWSCSK